jgi:cytoskeletal protein CcmA (bactofilin family)
VNVGVATVFFFVLVFAVAALPFVPAFREMRLHRDASPLAVSRRSRVDVRHFANGLRDFLLARIGWALEEVRESRTPVEGRADGVGSYIVVPSGGEVDVEQLAGRIAVGTGDLVIRGDGLVAREVYGRAGLHFEGVVQLRAALAEAGLELADGSTVLRWIHAGKHLVTGRESRLFGRASADEAIFLRAGTVFERLHAPTILVGNGRPREVGRADPDRRVAPEELAAHVEMQANRALVRGDVRIPEDALVDYDLVAYGELRVGPRTRIIGNVKAHGRIIIEEGAWLEGSVVAVDGIELRPGAYVHGPILSEEDLRIGPDVRVGDLDRPSTARARHIELCERARVHGTLWASEEGRVVES